MKVGTLTVAYFLLLSMSSTLTFGGRLVKRSNGWFITGRGCGGSTQIQYLDEIPENPTSLECVFIPKDPGDYVHKVHENKCVHFDQTPRSWSDANKFCKGLHGRIYEPRDETEIGKATAYVTSFGSMTGTTYDLGGPWLGINDIEVDRTYVYNSDGKPADFFQWAPPDPHEADGEDCLCMMEPWSRLVNNWVDVPCNFVFTTLCELDPDIANAYGKECKIL